METPLQKAIMTEGRGSSWTDSEVKALLVIWAEDKIQQELEGAKRNKVVFENISRKLLESGIRRDWKQCRAKVKNLKTSYKKTKDKNNVSGGPRINCKFFNSLDRILGSRPATHTPVLLESALHHQSQEQEETDPPQIIEAIDTSENMHNSECESIDDGDDEVHISESSQLESSVMSKEEDDVPTTSASKPASHQKGRKRGKMEALEQIMESTMKKFCEYQKESEERYMKWEEERMKSLLEDEKQRREEERRHDVQLFAMLGDLFKQSQTTTAPLNTPSSSYNPNFYQF